MEKLPDDAEHIKRVKCVYDEHPLAVRDIQYLAPYSRLRYTSLFDDNQTYYSDHLF